MTVALQDQDFVSEFKQSSEFCIPHLKRLLPDLEGKRVAAVLRHQRACMESLKEELAGIAYNRRDLLLRRTPGLLESKLRF